MNGTTSVPKSVPSLVLDKVRLLSVSENNLQYCSIKVANKSLSEELNNVLFVVVVVETNRCKLIIQLCNCCITV